MMGISHFKEQRRDKFLTLPTSVRNWLAASSDKNSGTFLGGLKMDLIELENQTIAKAIKISDWQLLLLLDDDKHLIIQSVLDPNELPALEVGLTSKEELKKHKIKKSVYSVVPVYDEQKEDLC
jgi:hypothetical protein